MLTPDCVWTIIAEKDDEAARIVADVDEAERIVAQVCGPNHKNMTFGERDDKVFAAIKEQTGYDVVRAYDGYGFAASHSDNPNHVLFFTYFGEVVRHFLTTPLCEL